MLTLRDPIHGFIHADALESALIDSAPVQRLRAVHQLGFTWLVYPGAEHSRFSHVLGAMQLAGRVYDTLAAKSAGLLEPGPEHGTRRGAPPARRLVRAAALLHDIGHAPFSHSAEHLFEERIDHEEMTRRLLATPEIQEVFDRHGDGLTAEQVAALLAGGGDGVSRLLAQIVSGELDVDKMDYLLRDGLYCGVRYGDYDLDRLLDTMEAIQDPETGDWGLGVDEGGVHALEALVMARYYMFTQVYFNVTGKALELHFSEWLDDTQRRWPADPQAFLAHDDVSTLAEMRRSDSLHARAVVTRRHFPLAYQSREHVTVDERERIEEMVETLKHRFGEHRILVSRSAKDPHRLGRARVLVRRWNGELEPMEAASHFIRHLTRIDRYRIYAPPELVEEVGQAARRLSGSSS
ncbi:MAG: HD domain-containing protein [Thermoanaerobaculia bacterium]